MPLQEYWNEIDQKHKQWFEKAVTIPDSLDMAVKKPRICQRQTHRSNIPAESVEDCFKKVVSIPFVDYLLQEMDTRFSDLHKHATLGLMLVPSELEKLEDVEGLISFFKDDLPSP